MLYGYVISMWKEAKRLGILKKKEISRRSKFSSFRGSSSPFPGIPGPLRPPGRPVPARARATREGRGRRAALGRRRRRSALRSGSESRLVGPDSPQPSRLPIAPRARVSRLVVHESPTPPRILGPFSELRSGRRTAIFGRIRASSERYPKSRRAASVRVPVRPVANCRIIEEAAGTRSKT